MSVNHLHESVFSEREHYQRERQLRAYQASSHARSSSSAWVAPRHQPRLQVSEGYLHTKRVASRFKKHTATLQYAVFGVVLVGLLFALTQLLRTVCLDATSLPKLVESRLAMEQARERVKAEKTSLNEQINIYSSTRGIEELARDNLERVGPNEVLIRMRSHKGL